MKKILTSAFLFLSSCFNPSHAAEFFQYDYDDITIIPIQEKSRRFPKNLFTSINPELPFPKVEDFAGSINVFLIKNKTNNTYSLVDTGFGDTNGNVLAKTLQKLNIKPTEINAIFITHLHADHVGGLLNSKMQQDFSDDEKTSYFPNATVYLAETEYNAWEKDNILSFLNPYRTTQLHLFDYETELKGAFGSVIAHKKEGHTPGHTVYEMKVSPNEKIYFIGDIVHAADLQIPIPEFCAQYDMDPQKAVHSRKEVFKNYSGDLFGAHVPFPGKIKITSEIADGKETFTYKLLHK